MERPLHCNEWRVRRYDHVPLLCLQRHPDRKQHHTSVRPEPSAFALHKPFLRLFARSHRLEFLQNQVSKKRIVEECAFAKIASVEGSSILLQVQFALPWNLLLLLSAC